MGKVYVVTAGSYSDYRIEAVFSSRKKAQDYQDYIDAKSQKLRLKNHYYEEFNDIEEYTLNDPPTFMSVYCVHIDMEGTETGRFHNMRKTTEYTEARHNGPVRIRRNENITGISTRSFDVALKAARDKLAEVKARDAGV